MNQHYKILGILYLVMAGFTVIAAFTVSFILQLVMPHVEYYEGVNVLELLSIFLLRSVNHA